jgi:drug/metabolite transporter (DMT)-like permease
MSNHPDTLVAYAKWFGKIKEVVKSAEMSYIDCKVCCCLSVVCHGMLTPVQSMSLTCTLQNGAQRSVVVPINPPLTGYEDVKPRLLEMKALAQEGLGMVSALFLKSYVAYTSQIKSPRISSLSLPRNALSTLSFTLFFVFLYFTPAQSPSTSHLLLLANTLQSLLGSFLISFTFWTLVTAHILESLYTLYICRNHSTGIVLGVSTSVFHLHLNLTFGLCLLQAVYVAATLLSGFPIWMHLQKKIQQARIDSVMCMKVQ